MASREEQLALICVVLFFCGAIAGYLPLLFNLKESTLNLVSAAGAGVLLGAAFAVILPEGFQHLVTQHDPHLVGAAEEGHGPGSKGEHEGHEHAGEVGGWAGLVVLLGFLTMLLLQQLTPSEHAHGHGAHGEHRHRSGKSRDSPPPSDDGAGLLAGRGGSKAKGTAGPSLLDEWLGQVGRQALVGLLVHALADGFAVGVACAGAGARVTILVAITMVLHKGPVAFGLTSYLMGQGWNFAQLQTAVVLFSLAAPLMASATFLALRLLAITASPSGPALCILYSGGTFIHAACLHILPEVLPPHGASPGSLLAVVLGSLAPALLQFMHFHEHVEKVAGSFASQGSQQRLLLDTLQ